MEYSTGGKMVTNITELFTKGGEINDLFPQNTTRHWTISPNFKDAEDYLEYQVATQLWLYYPPVVLLFGIIGNVLCFLVTTRRSLRKSSVGFCLAVLSLSDLLVLCVGLTRNYSIELSGWDIREVDQWLCKFHRFLLYFGLDFSAWILVTVTLERFISVCYPFRARSMCTLSRTKKILPLVACLVILENISVFWARGREYELLSNNITTIKTECGYPSDQQYFYWRHIRPYCVIGLYALGPFTTMIICSIRIVYQLRKAKRTMSVLSSRGMTASDQSLNKSYATTSTQSTTKAMKKHQDSYKMHSMTIMSVVVAIVFLCLTTPSHLEFLLEGSWNFDDPHDRAKFKLFEALTRLCMYTNHAINFIVYLASGQRFRQEFMTMIGRKKPETTRNVYSCTYTSVSKMSCDLTTNPNHDRVVLKSAQICH